MNKICTSIEQSKKLLELGVDRNTADIYYTTFYGKVDKDLPMPKEVYDILKYPINEDKCIPAWSLSALLEIIPNVEIKSEVQNFDNKSWCISSHDDKDYNHIWVYNDELVDACVELIEKLHKEELL